MDLINTALTLSNIPSPSGFEQAAIDAIAEFARAYASDMRRTPAGSLIVRRPGRGRRIMLITHADTTGFLTTYQESLPVFRFAALGPAGIHAAFGASVISTRGSRGVIGADIGADPAKLTGEQLYIEAPGAGLSEAFVLTASAYSTDGLIYAPSLVPSLSASVLLDVMAEAETEADVTFVFTAQHMLGACDAAAAAFTAAPEFAVTIDGIPARDIPGGDGTITLGNGIVISHQAGRAVSDPMLTGALIHAAEGSVQHDFTGSAVSDLASIQKVGVGIPAAAAGFAVRGPGMPLSCAALTDAEALSHMLQTFLASGIPTQAL